MRRVIKVVNFRRKREGRTDYKKRLKMLVSSIPRLVVRRTNKSIIVQVVEYSENGDKVIITANGSELKKHGLEVCDRESSSSLPHRNARCA